MAHINTFVLWFELRLGVACFHDCICILANLYLVMSSLMSLSLRIGGLYLCDIMFCFATIANCFIETELHIYN